MEYAKIIDEKILEYAKKNYKNIINFNLDEKLMMENGFYPVEDTEQPSFDSSYQTIDYKWVGENKKVVKEWTITDYRTKEEAEAEKAEREKEQKINELKEELNQIDLKSIRSVRDGDTEYIEKYKAEALEIREKIQELINQ